MRADIPSGRRVVITGLGVLSPIGAGVGEFLAGILAGRSGAKPITAFDTTGFQHAMGCEIEGFEPERWIQNLDPDTLGRASQFSAAAARMAVADAGLELDELRARRVLVSVGTTDGESRDLDTLIGRQLQTGPESLDGVVARRSGAGRLAATVVRELQLTDVEAVTIPTACAAGNYAIGDGYDAIRTGDVEIALSGGADAVCRKTFTGFYRLGTIAPDVCRPFDRDRKGILTGEGAGMLVMESLESALARGARIYAEVLGYGLNCDALHPVAPDPDSLARCIGRAHRNAGITAEDVDFISAHGTGTRANDVSEVAAIRKVFKELPPTISIKSMIGHTMGAASALASAACALAIHEQFIPPTINHRETDPECDIDCVPNEARRVSVDVVQNNALAFAGNNAVLILGRYRHEAPR
ncbi:MULTISPECIES: beta-ketoacyl-[acyl-carrier-protein] synthase family protein [Dactylosporangium]|uniref:3-oxoacyl-ACP synthase n=2 Tax=Dactylosporangium TaxID=35753 RepID=A0A9W6NKZ9_9ACTN|nr:MULTISPECIES: beta-ketoacyl-[acyl-carrier-protein] synthase family protein [Dactylosporangium]UAB94062.1 beta-ketoacyl-[acyl-carrier-protein] synthase family protein [Dactylosporangium vinaceum]GLL00613.1 3-oxoacyl-ACP synthase [Dactylosporangium matsuzakiense]